MVSTRSRGRKATQETPQSKGDAIDVAPPSRKRRRTHKVEKEDLPEVEADHNGSNSDEVENSTLDTKLPQTTAGKLTRFDSEEPDDGVLDDIKAEQNLESAEMVQDDDSADEEPDDIATSVATATLKASAASAKKATAARERMEKKKRKEVAARLEQQSKKSKVDRESKSSALTTKDSPELSQLPPTSSTDPAELKRHSIPALLPDDILAEEIPLHVPTQARHKQRQLPSNTRLRFPEETSAAKDRLVGPVKVSVLSTLNTMLPPKSNGPSKSLKEQWLTGRRPGRKGASHVERRTLNQAFVRS